MARTQEQIDTLLDSLSFELPRRSILFHKDTELPDQSLLGYTGNPNDVVPGNTPGETLIYNAAAGTHYQDRGILPYETWEKAEGGSGGIWLKGDSGAVAGAVITAGMSISYPNVRNRYLKYSNVPSNLVGWIPGLNVNITSITVGTSENSSGWVRIRKNHIVSNIYSIQLSAQTIKRVTGLNIALSATDSIQVYIQSTAGMTYPTVIFSGVTL